MASQPDLTIPSLEPKGLQTRIPDRTTPHEYMGAQYGGAGELRTHGFATRHHGFATRLPRSQQCESRVPVVRSNMHCSTPSLLCSENS